MIRSLFLIGAMLMTAQATAQDQPVGDYAEINGMRMYYEVSGEGDPLVVLHGAYMNIPAMGDIIGRLAESHTVYALELQGHGRTNDIERPITYPNFAGDVAAFMDEVGLERADVFGYSMGAATALRLAIDHPDKVDQLALISVSFSMEGAQPEFHAMLPTMSPEMFVGTPMETAFRELSPNPDGFRAFVERMIALEHEPMDWEADIPELEAPVLMITGDADVVTLEHSVALFRMLGGGAMGDMGNPLPASRFAVLPASSHTSLINQTDILMLMIEPFFEGETPRGMFDAP
jgi:pimeloyl-ACP methyl ester carboxylesterase